MKAYACNFEMAQKSNCSVSLKKVSHLKVLTCDGYFELKLKRNETVRFLSHLKVTCISYVAYALTCQHFLRCLFEPSQGPPRIQNCQKVFFVLLNLFSSINKIYTNDRDRFECTMGFFIIFRNFKKLKLFIFDRNLN